MLDQYYRTLFQTIPLQSLTQMMFKRITPSVLPLQNHLRDLGPQRSIANIWEVARVQPLGISSYMRHLILPVGHRINESAYRDEIEGGVNEKPMQFAYDCRCHDTQSALSRVIIGLHDDAQVSILALPKIGKSRQVCHALSNVETPADCKETPNAHVYNFAPAAGYDLRPRMSLYVRCDNVADLLRLKAFMSTLHQLTAFTSEFAELWENILFQCQEKVAEANQNTSQEKTKHSAWKLPLAKEIVEMKDSFDGFANQIPSTVEDSPFHSYAPKDILSFPSTVPVLHGLVLTGDMKALQSWITEFPESIFERDPWGKLAIETALTLADTGIAFYIFNCWYQLPYPKQWARQVFINAASILSILEHRQFNRLDPDIRISEANASMRHILPDMPQALVAYEHLLNGDEERFKKIIVDELNGWQELAALLNSENMQSLKQNIASRLPARFGLFRAVLIEDSEAIAASLEDRFQFPEEWHVRKEELPARYRYMESLKNKIHATINDYKSPESVTRIIEFVSAEFLVLVALRQKLLEEDARALVGLIEQHLGSEHSYMSKGGTLSRIRRREFKKLHQDIFEDDLFPEDFILIAAVLNKQWDIAKKYIAEKITAIQQTERKYPSLQAANSIVAEQMPTRSPLHLAAMRGPLTAADAWLEEKKNLAEFIDAISTIQRDSALEIQQLVVRLAHPNQLKYHKMIIDSVRVYSLEDLLLMLAGVIVIDEQSYEKFLNHYAVLIETLRKTPNALLAGADIIDEQGDEVEENEKVVSNNYEILDSCFRKLAAIKRRNMESVQLVIAKYKGLCQTEDHNEFVINTALVASFFAWHWLTDIGAYCQNEMFGNSVMFVGFTTPLLAILARLEKNLPSSKLQKFNIIKILDQYIVSEAGMRRFVAGGLLSYEAEDPWGYTPLLLAVVSDNLSYVETFLKSGFYSEPVKGQRVTKNGTYYSLVEHAQSPRMLELLFKFFYRADEKNNLFHRVENQFARVMLAYGHQAQLNYEKLTLIDRLILGRTTYENPLETLKLLLKYRDTSLPDAPFDGVVTAAVAAEIVSHNKKLADRKQRLGEFPKLRRVTFFNNHDESSYIFSDFLTPYSKDKNKQKRFSSEIKSINALTKDEREALAGIFARQFKLRIDDPKDTRTLVEKTKAFFRDHVLMHEHYMMDVYYESVGGKNHKVVGFFCYQIFNCEHPKYGRFNLFYASIAVFDEDAQKYGLASSALRTLIAAKKISDSERLPLKFYSRLGRPGIAYMVLPENAQFSTKYAVDEGLIKYIAEDVVGNKIEADGSSVPPVLSTVERKYSTRQLEEYDHLLDDMLHAHQDASLPVVFDVTNDVISLLATKLANSNSIREQNIEELALALKALQVETQYGFKK